MVNPMLGWGIQQDDAGKCDSIKADGEHDRRMSEAVFLNSHEAIIVTDARGHYRRVNPAFERLTGFSAAQVRGRVARLMATPDDEVDLLREMLLSTAERGRWTGEALQHTAEGRMLAVRCSVTALIDADGDRLGYMAILTDLSELRRASDEIARLATTDSLTDLPNRALFQDRLQQALSQARRRNQSFALLFADLDHFKEVNDTLGHAVGDELLVVIARRLRDSVREMDTVARLGGDEFVMLLPNINRAQAIELADRLLQHLQQPMTLDGLPDYRAQASVGMVMYPDDGVSLDELMRHADQAMYAAKRGGRNQLQAYTNEMGASSKASFDLQRELRAALELGQLEVHLQPKFRLEDMAVVGAEALVRWQHPRLGLLSSADFLHVAEQHQLLGAMDTWVLQTTLEQIAAWAAQGAWPQDWTISVNQTVSDIQQSHWLSQLETMLAMPHLQARWLDIELTEAVWARPTPELLDRLGQFRALGVSLSIDDFGTGYSSLSYLKQLPVTGVKIDQGFVRGMMAHERDRVLVETISELVRRLKLGLLAEGVETEQHRQQLLQLGCPLGQGYLLCGPLPLAEFGQRFLALQADGRAVLA